MAALVAKWLADKTLGFAAFCSALIWAVVEDATITIWPRCLVVQDLFSIVFAPAQIAHA
jgi:hypothetical protein